MQSLNINEIAENKLKRKPKFVDNTHPSYHALPNTNDDYLINEMHDYRDVKEKLQDATKSMMSSTHEYLNENTRNQNSMRDEYVKTMDPDSKRSSRLANKYHTPDTSRYSQK